MIRKLLVAAAGAVAADFLTDNATVKAQVDKMAGAYAQQTYAAINGLGAALALKYFGG